MTYEEKVLKAISALGEEINQKEFEIELRDFQIGKKDEEIKNLEAKIDKQNEYIKDLEARIYDLEERIEIMTESEAPSPVWDITPAPATKKEGE